MAAVKPMVDAGDELILFTIASGMSTTSNVFRMVAEDLEAEDKIHVVDSQNLSTGIGLLVIEAAEMAKAGPGAEDILNEISQEKKKQKALKKTK